MRDKRFVAIHRGGTLTKADHRKLMKWARECSEHILAVLELQPDFRLINALHMAKEWENGAVTTGIAIKAALQAHEAAREFTDPVLIAVARSVGHAVATAHMADHSVGAALYAIKAIKLAGKAVDDERTWQINQLIQFSPEIRNLILRTLDIKGKALNVFDQ